ncbi:S-layer homology domain-containing protein [Paenibacillus albiflavus]|uniref:S-layer homology domain-containing protein n=1 Tax=Paenibacillus albiflavus TaxID=2545760 RepID=UPI001404A62C|nr:S-layer homology domain-containing protein [Paenibacillus albiflavus]
MKLLKMASTVAVASALLLSTAAPAVMAASTEVSTSEQTMIIDYPDGKTQRVVEAKLSKEQAIEIANKYIQIPSDYKLQSANLNSDWSNSGSSSSWYLNFTKQDGERTVGGISVNIDGNTGRLQNYNSYVNDPEYKPSFPPKVNFNNGKAIADKWLSSINPKEYEQIKYNDRYEEAVKPPLDGNVQYNYSYVRLVNGVPFPQDTVSVNVNGDGQVVSYYSNWTPNVKFEAKDNVIPLADALKIFRNKSQLSLLYQLPYQVQGEKKPYTAYMMDTFMLNAKSGEWWSPYGDTIAPSMDDKPISDKPLGNKPASNLKLTKDDAIKKVEQSFTIPQGYTLQNASYNEYFNPENNENMSNWSLSWSLSAPDKELTKRRVDSMVYANVNASTGEIMNYNYYVNNYDPLTGTTAPVEAKITVDQAKTKAIEFAKKMVPYYAHELVLANTQDPQVLLKDKNARTLEFNFKHVSDGVTIGYNNLTISIDKETGEITNYYANFSLTEYPTKKPSVITLDKAKDLLLSQYDVELAYVTEQKPMLLNDQRYALMVASGEIKPNTEVSKTPEAKLVYQLVSKYQREPFFLDAITGTWKSMSTGDQISLDKVKVVDIDNHWAKEALQLMLDYQALDIKNGKVSPDESITKGEMVKMLVITMNGGYSPDFYAMAARKNSFADVTNQSKYFAYVETALDRRLIDKADKFNPDQKMTRDDMATLIVRALGFDKLAQFSSMFNTSFTDVADVKNQGAAAIAIGLGIMTVDNGMFNPKKEVTRADAASAFYRYLQKRSLVQTNY